MRAAAAIMIMGWLAATPSVAHDFRGGSIDIKHPWSQVAPPVAPVLGGYVTIVNIGTTPDRLLGGTVSIAEKLELHQSSAEAGIARMRPVPSIDIQPGETVRLEPGGMHIMFVTPISRPKVGETFKAVLEFEKAGPIEVEFVVQGRKVQMPQQDHNVHPAP